MRCLLDTNLVSEATKPKPDPRVLAWLAQQELAEAYLSVITIGEIEQGVARLGASKRAERYRNWLEADLARQYAGRILALDEPVLRVWGRITGAAISQGRPPALLDSLLAATAIRHELVLVTRNTRDIATLPVATFNPWLAGPR